MVYRELLAREAIGESEGSEKTQVLELVAEVHSTMRRVTDNAQPPSCSQAPVLLVGDVGRPRFEIPCRQLEYLA